MTVPTHQLASKNALDALHALKDHVEQRLRSLGVKITDYVPFLSILQEVLRQKEPLRSRLLVELRQITFPIACSHEINVMWDRRQYYAGPQVQGFSLPVAIKILQHAEANNRRPTVVEQTQELRPMLLHWDNFETGRQGAYDIDAICRGATYQWLLKQYRDEKHFDRRAPGVIRPNVAEIFRAKQPDGAGPDDYAEASKSVVAGGFRPGLGRGQLPQAAVVSALAASPAGTVTQPPPPPPPPPGVKG